MEEDERIITSQYFTGAHGAVAFVAVKGYSHDWAAYVGACSQHLDGDVCVKDVAKWGAKLPEKWARVIFPDIDLVYRP